MEKESSTGSSEIIVVIGIQGSGKSHYSREFSNNNARYHHINRDDIRRVCFPPNSKWDDTYWYEGYVAEIEDKAIYIATQLGYNIILDEGFNCIKQVREATLKRLKSNYKDFRITAHVILCDLPKALERNRQRTGKDFVPERTVRHFHKELVKGLGGSENPWIATETLMAEGFDNVEISFN